MNINSISEYVSEVLKSAGWSFDRKVSTDIYQNYFKEEGMSCFPEAIEILENFGGLKVNPPLNPDRVYGTGELEFDPIMADWATEVKGWEKKFEEPICCLGSIWGDNALLVLSEKGGFYSLSDAGVHYIADNFADALEVLIAATSKPSQVYKLEDFF
ncbi:SUKH-3 domain-containing protein [uncultured Gimesia sp.]|uniref:SUKH-3 domain-containing protein n=1 Tax=uncultured Gimesia sp. TaxID=1678688 RepID=UPI0030DA93AD